MRLPDDTYDVGVIGPGVTMLIEVPDYFELNGRHYLLYSTAYCLGVTCNTRS